MGNNESMERALEAWILGFLGFLFRVLGVFGFGVFGSWGFGIWSFGVLGFRVQLF